MTVERSPEKIPGNAPLLRDILAETVFKPGRVIPDEVNEIDLGVFSEEALALANECFNDPKNSDVAKIVYVSGAKKVLVQKTVFHSLIKGVLPVLAAVSSTPKATAERYASNDKYIGMFLLTSGNTNLPFSARPISLLLESDSDLFALTAAFIAGRSQNILIMRGENALQLTSKDAEQKRNLWSWQISERIKQFTEPGMDQGVRTAIVERAGSALLQQICERYGLVYFAGESDSRVVTRQSPQRPQAE